jgi:hypothetical protein
MTRCALTTLAIALSAGPVVAQAPLRFQWQVGQVQTYSVRHSTTVTETTLDEKDRKPATSTAVTTVTLHRRWEVKAVDPAGVATLDMAITALVQEHTRPGGERITIDSATSDGAKAFGEFLGKTIVTAKIDARGQLIEAKSTAGDQAAARLSAELPFRVVLPEQAPVVNAAWDRAFAIKLDPPLGTGETYDATQTYTYKGLNGPYAVIGLATALKAPPATPAELQPLVSWLWEGDVFIDTKTGRYYGAKLTAKKEIPNHQGDGTKFAYQSEYTEAAVSK